MTTDFRALCAELIASWDADGCDWKPQHQARWEATVNRARAALAVPECRGPAAVTGQPSDEELADTYWKAWHEYHDRTNSVLHSVGLRAVLARWGNPAPTPPADGEVAELTAWLRETGDTIQPSHLAEHQRYKRAAELLQQMEDLAADAVAGLRYIEESCGRLYGVGWDRVYGKADRLKPAHALPIPKQQETNNG